MTDLPDLPAGWRWSTVADVGKVQLGRQRAPQHHTGEHMRPYLRVANVFEDRIDTTDVMEMNFTPDEFETYRLHPGDILLNEGQSPELLGRPAMYRGDPVETAFTNSLIRFQAGEDVLPEWALIVFRHHMHSGRFKRECRVTTNIAHLSANRFKTVEFPIPPLPLQAELAASLQSALEGVERGERSARKQQTHLRALRRALLQRAFSTSRPREQDATDELVETITAARTSGTAPAAARGLTPAPAGATTVSLDFLTRPDRKAAYGILQPGADTPGGVPLVRVGDVIGGTVRTEGLKHVACDVAEAYPRTRLRGGELLITLVGTIGRVGVVPESLADANVARAVGVLPLTEHVNAQYVALCLQAEPWASALVSRSHEVARKTLNLADVRAFPVLLVGRHEQDRIVRELTGRLEVIDDALERLEALGRRLSALRRSFIAAAYRGDLVQVQHAVDAPNAKRGAHRKLRAVARPARTFAAEPAEPRAATTRKKAR